jgi:hypothetical protein
MKILAVVALCLALGGCGTVQSWVPSFWDANQSHRIVDIAVAIDRVDCSADQKTQAEQIQADILWFIKYSETKGVRQQDVIKLVKPMSETVDDWITRAGSERGASRAYCDVKKTLLQQQSTRAARAVQGRF